MKKSKLQQIQLFKDVVEEAVDRGVSSVQRIHETIAEIPLEAMSRNGVMGHKAQAVRRRQQAIISLVYDTIRQVTRGVGEFINDQLENLEGVEEVSQRMAADAGMGRPTTVAPPKAPSAAPPAPPAVEPVMTCPMHAEPAAAPAPEVVAKPEVKVDAKVEAKAEAKVAAPVEAPALTKKAKAPSPAKKSTSAAEAKAPAKSAPVAKKAAPKAASKSSDSPAAKKSPARKKAS